LNRHGFAGGLRLESCFEIPSVVAADLGDGSVAYLQFGADDAGMAARWARVLADSGSTFTVFAPPSAGDRWLPARGHGHAWAFPHSVGNDPRAAVQHDQRVRVLADAPLRELFAQHEWSEELPLVAVFDIDYYPTTKLALDLVRGRMPPTTYLFFDQLNHRADELRAFHEFLMETDARFELFAANRELSCVVFRRTA
jgi:hypothetical protein